MQPHVRFGAKKSHLAGGKSLILPHIYGASIGNMDEWSGGLNGGYRGFIAVYRRPRLIQWVGTLAGKRLHVQGAAQSSVRPSQKG